MIAFTRRAFILELLENKGIISIKDAAKELNVAEITIRRDFEKLEAEGKLKRVHGGAATPGNLDGAELTMTSKLPQNIAAKEKVAQKAASIVRAGESIFIDGGTTMMPLAAQLMKLRVKIVTYNTMILQQAYNPAAEIILIGGEYKPHYKMNVGSLAQEMLKNFYFDRAFYSCAGIDAKHQVVYTTEYESLNMKKIAMKNAKENHLLVDSSKFSKQGFLKFCDTVTFASILTDELTEEAKLLQNIVSE